MNTIVISFSPEDRKVLEDLTGAVAMLASVIGNHLPKGTQEKVIEELTAPLQEEDVAIGLPVEGAAHLEPVVVEPAPEPAPVSLGEFQKAIVTRCAVGAETKEKVQALIHLYAASVSAVPEAKRAEVLAALDKI